MERHPLPRPTLLPGLRLLWRNRHTVQVGTDPGQAVVLELPHPAAARLFDLLDGARTERAVLAEMGRIGLAAPQVHEVLGALVEAGLVVPADALLPAALPAARRDQLRDEAAALALRDAGRPGARPSRTLRRRAQARIVVAGHGPLAELLGETLQAAGVGTVAWVDRPGGTARLAGSAGHTLRATDATFRVQVGPAVSGRGTRRRVPHLALGVRDGTAVVGPLVPATGGPCLRCLDLHRADRDPCWPDLAAQLAQAAPVRDPCAAATRVTAAGFAAAEILAFLDGAEPTTIGTTVEINGVAPWRRRSWSPHPACDCTRRRR
ncbi:hypothetical protein QEZ54_02545 [Catellatospora sp. KI3]|uniref:hypothetical protein n=1 Tax=Catellatospora sp. KI3 TaxID=3041620 RepID=UPI00248277EB|nr:hypothetical protein [Catellatospora sp. KI3]MDI1459836.1 hypothetical protein [Catellatospora sp. KI3]